MISVTDSGPGIRNLAEILDGKYISTTGLGKGIIGTKRLMDYFDITSSPNGTCVETGKDLPSSATPFRAESVRIGRCPEAAAPPIPSMKWNAKIRSCSRPLPNCAKIRTSLAALDRELEDTNRGVVALYAELDRNADDLRRVSDLKTSFLSNLSHEFVFRSTPSLDCARCC